MKNYQNKKLQKPFHYSKFILILLFSFIYINSYSQVKNIKRNIEKNKPTKEKKSPRSNRSNYSSEERSSLAGDITMFFFDVTFRALAHGTYSAQTSALSNRNIYRQRLSFELRNSYGIGSQKNINYLRTGARFNWGIFGTDFKYTNLEDVTGNLKNIDWSVLVLRLPIKNFNIDYGLGFIKIIDPKKTYFKSAIGLEWNIKKPDISLSFSHHFTENTTLNSRFLKSFNSGIDIKLMSLENFHIYSMFEYSNQNYFDDDHFSFYNLGLVLKIF